MCVDVDSDEIQPAAKRCFRRKNEKLSTLQLRALFGEVCGQRPSSVEAVEKVSSSEERLLVGLGTGARPADFDMQLMALPEISMDNDPMVVLGEIFTLLNVKRLFEGEFNHKFLRLPKIYLEENYDPSRFEFEKLHIEDRPEPVEYLLFLVTEENVKFIKNLLLEFAFETKYIVAPKGVGKSFSAYFITCLLMGINVNYSSSVRAKDLAEVRLWKGLCSGQILGRIPVYAANPASKLHTFEEITRFCLRFYPAEIGNELGELRRSVGGEFTHYLTEYQVMDFTKILGLNSWKLFFIIDQIDAMKQSMTPKNGNLFISLFAKSLFGILSSSSNIEVYAEPGAALPATQKIQGPIFQFDLMFFPSFQR